MRARATEEDREREKKRDGQGERRVRRDRENETWRIGGRARGKGGERGEREEAWREAGVLNSVKPPL